ncbi:MAG: ABC transporter permease [Xanthobacteraceae bacterium]|nr:ABC transporter permease [Xanthobacteraceae bacterium]
MLLGFAIVLALWYLLVDLLQVPRFKELPSLLTVVEEWVSKDPIYGISIFTSEYYRHIFTSLLRVGIAFTLATAIGVPLGLFLGWSQRFREYVFPIFETLRPIPPLAWIPLAILMFQGRETPIIFLTFLASFFATTLNTMLGVRSIDETYVRAARCLGANDIQIFRHVVIPGSLRHIFNGLQISIGVAWFSLVAAEMVSGEYGLGYMINTGYTMIAYPTIVIGMITLGLVGFATSMVVSFIGARLTAWQASGNGKLT